MWPSEPLHGRDQSEVRSDQAWSTSDRSASGGGDGGGSGFSSSDDGGSGAGTNHAGDEGDGSATPGDGADVSVAVGINVGDDVGVEDGACVGCVVVGVGVATVGQTSQVQGHCAWRISLYVSSSQ